MKIHTKFQDEGICKRTISLEDQKKLILEGKEVTEINFEGTEIEKRVINKGTNALIVKEFMEESIKDPNGVLPGKTIFFCTSISHARRIEKLIMELTESNPILQKIKEGQEITEELANLLNDEHPHLQLSTPRG